MAQQLLPLIVKKTYLSIDPTGHRLSTQDKFLNTIELIDLKYEKV